MRSLNRRLIGIGLLDLAVFAERQLERIESRLIVRIEAGGVLKRRDGLARLAAIEEVQSETGLRHGIIWRQLHGAAKSLQGATIVVQGAARFPKLRPGSRKIGLERDGALEVAHGLGGVARIGIEFAAKVMRVSGVGLTSQESDGPIEVRQIAAALTTLEQP